MRFPYLRFPRFHLPACPNTSHAPHPRWLLRPTEHSTHRLAAPSKPSHVAPPARAASSPTARGPEWPLSVGSHGLWRERSPRTWCCRDCPTRRCRTGRRAAGTRRLERREREGGTGLAAGVEGESTRTVVVCAVQSNKVRARKGGGGLHEDVGQRVGGVGHHDGLAGAGSHLFQSFTKFDVDVDVFLKKTSSIRSSKW